MVLGTCWCDCRPRSPKRHQRRRPRQQQQQQRAAVRRVMQLPTLGDSSVSSRVTDVALVFVTLSSD